MDSALMGRPKKTRPKGEKPPEYRTVNLRARVEWAEWLDKAAAHCRTDVAKLIDAAVYEYAQARGFKDDPPPRY